MSETERISGEYWVPVANLPPLETKIKKLQKRAAKLEAPPITFAITPDRENRHVKTISDPMNTDEHGRPAMLKIFREYARVIVQGEAPKYNGWSLIARLIHPERGETASNIINAAPGKACPKEFRETPPKCDHCKKGWIWRQAAKLASIGPNTQTLLALRAHCAGGSGGNQNYTGSNYLAAADSRYMTPEEFDAAIALTDTNRSVY